MAITAAQIQVLVEAETRSAVSGLRAVHDEIQRVGKQRSVIDAMTGAVRGMVNALGQIGLAAMGVNTLAQSLFGLGRSLLGGNVALENVTAQFRAFTKDANLANQIIQELRAEAARTPFAFQDMAESAATLLPAAQQAGVELMDLVRTAEILAALNPAQGLTGAAFALREALSGDFVSVVERFNLPRQYLNELKSQGVPAIEAVRIALQQLGADSTLVTNLAGTMSGRWSTLTDILRQLRDTATQPIFAMLSSGLGQLTTWMEQNQPRLESIAQAIGDNLARAVGIARDAVITLVQALRGEWEDDERILPIHRVFGRIGLAIREVLPTIQSALQELRGQWDALVTGFTTGETGGFAQNLGVGLRNFVSIVREEVLPAAREFVGWLRQEAAPAVQEFAGRVAPVVQRIFGLIGEKLPSLVPAVAGFATVFAGLSAAAGPISGLLGPLMQVFNILRMGITLGPALMSIVGVLGGPVTLAIAGLAAAAVGLYAAWQTNFLGIRDIVSSVWNAVQPVIQAIVQHFQRFATEIAPLAAQAWQNISAVISTVVSTIASIVSTVLTSIAGFLSRHADEIRQIIAGAWQMITGVVKAAVSVIEGVIKLVLAVIAGDWAAAWDALKGIVSGVWDGIKTVIAGALDILKGVITIALEEIQRIWERIWGGLRDAAGRLLDGAKEAVSAGIEKIKQLFTGASEWLVEAGKDIVRGLVNGITSMIDWAKQRAGELVSGVVSSVKSALGIRSPSRVMAEIGENAAQGLAQGMQAGAGQVALVASELAARIAEAFAGLDAASVQERAEAIRDVSEAFAELYATLRQMANVDPEAVQIPAELVEYLPAVAADLARALEEGMRELIPENLQRSAGAAREAIQAIADTLRFAREASAIDPDTLFVPPELMEYLPSVAAAVTRGVEESFRELATANIQEYAAAARNALQVIGDVLAFARETADIDPEQLLIPEELVEYLPTIARRIVAGFAATAAELDSGRLNEHAAAVRSVFETLNEVFAFTRTVSEAGRVAWERVAAATQNIFAVISAMMSQIATGWKVLEGDSFALAADAMARLTQPLRDLVEIVSKTAEIAGQLRGRVVDNIAGILSGATRAVAQAVAELGAVQIGPAASTFEGMRKLLESLQEFVRGVGDGTQGANVIRGIRRVVQSIAALGPEMAQAMSALSGVVSEKMYDAGVTAGTRFASGFRTGLSAVAALPGPGLAGGSFGNARTVEVQVRVYIGERELREIVRREIVEFLR